MNYEMLNRDIETLKRLQKDLLKTQADKESIEALNRLIPYIENQEKQLKVGENVWCILNPGKPDMELAEKQVCMATQVYASSSIELTVPGIASVPIVKGPEDVGKTVFRDFEEAKKEYDRLKLSMDLEMPVVDIEIDDPYEY